MLNHQDVAKKASNYVKKSVTLKIVSIGILILLMLIPAGMIQNLIRERQMRRNSAVQEISQKWGSFQTITGPFLSVPFKTFFKDTDGKTQYKLSYLQILPETLDVTGEIKPEVRYRSLFEAVLYNIRLKFSGNFKLPSMTQLNIDPNNILWDKAYLSLGITDMRGIQDKIIIHFNGSAYNAEPGLKSIDLAVTQL